MRWQSVEPREDDEQVLLFDWLALQRFGDGSLADYYWHIPNGGLREKRTAARLKRMGTKPGVPDIFGCLPAPPFHGHFIELKSADGRLTTEQLDVIRRLRVHGYRVDVCRGFDEAVSAIREHLRSVQ